MPPPRGNRIIEHLNKDVRVRTKDGWYEGRFRAFDKHMNLILAKAAEIRIVRSRNDRKEVSMRSTTVTFRAIEAGSLISCACR